MTKKWLFIMAKSGALFAFDSEKVKLVYQDGYFIADGLCSLGGHDAFRQATNITIYHDDICCHWNEEAAL